MGKVQFSGKIAGCDYGKGKAIYTERDTIDTSEQIEKIIPGLSEMVKE